MSEPLPSPAPFDPSLYTAEELHAARLAIHWLYRAWDDPDAPEEPFDHSAYSADELVLMASVIAALRQGPPEPPPRVTVSQGPAVEWLPGRGMEGGSVARLVLRRTTAVEDRHGSVRRSVETLGALTDWFDCPTPAWRGAAAAQDDGSAGGSAAWDALGALASSGVMTLTYTGGVGGQGRPGPGGKGEPPAPGAEAEPEAS